eukprot:scaffold195367_cov21-Tisochrysis_lutea.AAC.1
MKPASLPLPGSKDTVQLVHLAREHVAAPVPVLTRVRPGARQCSREYGSTHESMAPLTRAWHNSPKQGNTLENKAARTRARQHSSEHGSTGQQHSREGHKSGWPDQ